MKQSESMRHFLELCISIKFSKKIVRKSSNIFINIINFTIERCLYVHFLQFSDETTKFLWFFMINIKINFILLNMSS